MAYEYKRDLLGVIGGLGPLASAEFLKTIYEFSLGEHEQESPAVVVYSDPTFPDRTEAFLNGNDDVLLARLIEVLHILRELKVSKIVICCVTMHYLVPRLPQEFRKRIVSLVDVILANVVQDEKKYLLVCSNGTRRLGIFQTHWQWERAKDYIILPDESDQHTIHHDLIYRVKRNSDISELIPLLETLLAKYKVDSFVAGCTEIHMLAKHFMFSAGYQKGYQCIDPLSIIAQEVARATGDRSRSFSIAPLVGR
jgi:aspartate racemase